MAAISLAKSAAAALTREKPRSSITEWVDILTSSNYENEVYDGIPELIDSINLQAAGPAEASRALRKKLKHGNAHQQYRALVILNALVENSGHKFQTTFADGQLTDAIRHLASDPLTDPKVKRKLIGVLASWQRQFKDDRSMATVAGLYRQCHGAKQESREHADHEREREREQEKRRQEEKNVREEAKRKAKLEKEAEKERERERLKKAAEAKKRPAKDTIRRKPFNFEEEKPKVMNSIANASSAANNLINAITLVNTEHDSLQTNERVQECLTKAKQSRKLVVRYIQLVEDEEFIGTLIDTNERIISALDTYDKLSKPDITEQDVEQVQKDLAGTHIGDSELSKLHEKQRAAVQRAVRHREKDRAHDADEPPHSAGLHPDLHDLSFGTLGNEQGKLPPPIRPTVYGSDDDEVYRRGSLSDFSDYESSDEAMHARAGPSSGTHHYQYSSDDEPPASSKTRPSHEEEDPFADPFMD
ncbi:hypothetical protein EVG20_g226 [Dentipellis fragilis]|uniref:VHS domain-containing protein n=1 Tax=Dentipellis fragilis TaxID=205917 RepID=A0A4Y9ZD91_9AGAM|nr:hypothetical protein EVG20_g226 [Dentipellis fragilis]